MNCSNISHTFSSYLEKPDERGHICHRGRKRTQAGGWILCRSLCETVRAKTRKETSDRNFSGSNANLTGECIIRITVKVRICHR